MGYVSKIPPSANEFKLEVLDAFFRHTALLRDIPDPSRYKPVFESFETIMLVLVTFLSQGEDARDARPPTFKFPDIPTPPDTTRDPSRGLPQI